MYDKEFNKRCKMLGKALNEVESKYVKAEELKIELKLLA